MERWALGRFIAGIFSILLTTWPALSAGSASADRSPQLTGVNLAGAEFNPNSSRLHFDYTYPTAAEIDAFAAVGLRTFRVPVLSRRLLDASGARVATESADWRALSALIDHAAQRASDVIIDLHQYGSMPSGLVGRSEKATEEFIAFWRAVASSLRDRPNVIFGLMNEPNAQDAKEWLGAANAGIAAIRQAGAKQLVLVPGSYWDGAHSWTGSDNAAVMIGVIDPARHIAFEVHQYLDANSSGTSAQVVPGAGATRLAAFTAWARQHRVTGYLGEFGFAATPEALREGEAMLAYLKANRDVWLGWTYWTGGPWMGSYMFTVEPTGNRSSPQLELLKRFR